MWIVSSRVDYVGSCMKILTKQKIIYEKLQSILVWWHRKSNRFV